MLAARGIPVRAYEDAELVEVAAMLGAAEPERDDSDEAREVIGDPLEFLPPDVARADFERT